MKSVKKGISLSIFLFLVLLLITNISVNAQIREKFWTHSWAITTPNFWKLEFTWATNDFITTAMLMPRESWLMFPQVNPPYPGLNVSVFTQFGGPKADEEEWLGLYLMVYNAYKNKVEASIDCSLLDIHNNTNSVFSMNAVFLDTDKKRDNIKSVLTHGRGTSKFVKIQYIMDNHDKLIHTDKGDALFIRCVWDSTKNNENVANGCGVLYEPLPVNNWFDNALGVYVNDAKFSDFVIDVIDNSTAKNNKTRFIGHQYILSAGSNSVRTFLNYRRMRNKDQNQGKIIQSVYRINVINVTHDAFLDVLHYIYTGQPRNLKTRLVEIWKVAFKLGVRGLKDLCEELICRNLTPRNIKRMYYLAVAYKASRLQTKISSLLKTEAPE